MIIFAPLFGERTGVPGGATVLRVFAIGLIAYMVQENYRVLLNGLFNQRAILAVNLSYNAIRLLALYIVTSRAGSLVAVVIVETAALFAALIFYTAAYRLTMQRLHRKVKVRLRIRCQGGDFVVSQV